MSRRIEIAKASIFIGVVMVAAYIMGLLFMLQGQVYMFAPLLSVLFVMLVAGDILKKKRMD